MRLRCFCVLVGVLSAAIPATAQWSPDDPLMPTGNSTSDTANLQAAIHNYRLDSGGTLYLGPGTFLVHATVFRQASSSGNPGYNPAPFNGTIQGAAKGVTIIRSVRGPGGEPFTPIYDFVMDQTIPGTFFIWDEDYFGVRDMTFEAESEIADPYWYAGLYWQGLFNFIGLGTAQYGVGNAIGTDCIRVHFKGSVDTYGLPEMPYLFEAYGGSGGTHSVKSTEFENAFDALYKIVLYSNATINIGGSPKGKVTFNNSFGASVFTGCGDCTVNVSHIETQDAPGVHSVFGYYANAHSSITVTHNTINPIGDSWYAGVEMWAWNGEVDAVISQNRIHSEDSFLWGPIFAEGVSNGVITNNVITGRGPAAIYLGVYSWWPGSFTLVGNNLQNWETTGPNPWGFWAAPIWLGPFVIDSTVVGASNGWAIFDEPAYDTSWNPLYDVNGNPLTIPGYGDLIPPGEFGNLVPKNNVFTGVNNMHVNIGLDVRDAMQQKVEAKRLMMRR